MLEKIRKKFQVYDLQNYNQDPRTIIGTQEYRPVDPTVSYMSSNIFELYELFIQLQQLVLKNHYSDRDITIIKIQFYFYSDQFKKCDTLIRKAITKYPKDKSFLKVYLFLCKYNLGIRNKAYSLLEDVLKEKPHLVSNRDFFSEHLKDDKIVGLIKKYYSNDDFREMVTTLKQEHVVHENYINQQKTLLKYYIDKRQTI